MILLVHLLFGAAVGSLVKNVPLAIILAILSHYFLDLFPHVEYNIDSLDKKQWRDRLPAIVKIALDFCLGILAIFMFSKNQPIVYVYALLAVLPDGLTVLNNLLPNKVLESHRKFHIEGVHFLRNKKISLFWRILSQVIAVTVAIIMFRL